MISLMNVTLQSSINSLKKVSEETWSAQQLQAESEKVHIVSAETY